MHIVDVGCPRFGTVKFDVFIVVGQLFSIFCSCVRSSFYLLKWDHFILSYTPKVLIILLHAREAFRVVRLIILLQQVRQIAELQACKSHSSGRRILVVLLVEPLQSGFLQEGLKF